MLYNNHNIKIAQQNFSVMEKEWFGKSFLTSENVLMSLRSMLKKSKKLERTLATEVFNVALGKSWLKQKDFDENIEQLAVYGAFMSGMVYAYDLDEPDPSKRFRLYTTSMSVIRNLAANGMIDPKKEALDIVLQKLEKTLYESNRIKDSFKDYGKIVSVRLDPVAVTPNKVVFTATIPKTAINYNRCVLAPYETVATAYNMFLDYIQNGVVRVTMGDKVRTVTMNASVLSSVYGAPRATFLCNQIKSVLSNRFYVPSLGASEYTLGVTNIRLQDVDKFEVLSSIAEVDLSEIHLNLLGVTLYFIKKLKGLDVNGLTKVKNDLEVECDATDRKSLLQACILRANAMNQGDIWEYIKANTAVFNHVEYMNETHYKFGDRFDYMPIPRDVTKMREVLESGLFKVVVSKRDGSFSTLLCTNSEAELERVLGKNYVGKYESEGVRLRVLRDMINRGEVIDINATLAELNLVGVVDNTNGIESVKASIESSLEDVEQRKTVINQPHLISVRCVDAYLNADNQPVGFYGSIDPNNVVLLICLHSTRKPNKR